MTNMNMNEIEELGRKLAQAEHDVIAIKNEILARLGVSDAAGYGLIKIDWQMVKGHRAPTKHTD